MLLPPAPPPNVPPPAMPHRPPIVVSTPIVVSPGRVLVPVIMMIVLVVIGIVVSVVTSSRGGLGPSKGSGPGAGGVVPAGERLQWASSAKGSVLNVDINHDGVEDFLGRYHILDLSTRESTQTEYVGAFDGKTFRRIWASPPLGTLQQSMNQIAFGVAGNKVIVTDYRAQAHILDLGTGKVAKVFTLSDRAKEICSPGDTRSEVWIHVVDDKNVVFNLDTGAATLGPSPSWCRPASGTVCNSSAFLGAPCSPTIDDRTALMGAGMHPEILIRSADRAYAVGRKSAGTAVGMVMAFNPTTKATLWQSAISPDPSNSSFPTSQAATLYEGKLYLTYKSTTPSELHLVVFDGATGKRGMDVKVPRGHEGTEPNEILVTSQRIYVPHWTWLDIMDSRDGRFIETVGMW